MSKLLSLNIVEINQKLKNKEIKPLDLVLEAFDNIEKNSDLNCMITLNKEKAVERAKELESLEVDNLLFGIPIILKDNIVTKDLRTTAASKILENFIPVYNATVVDKINEYKMIIIGKTNMDEFAMGSSNQTSYFGPVLNPWNRKLVPGGSSGGNAAAISSCIVPLALGSDTGGSIRQPAAFTGIVGLKPTYGRVSRYGLIAFASSLDQIGPMTKNVYENALLLNAIVGLDDKDMTTKELEAEDFTRLIGNDIKGMRLAIPNYYLSEMIDSEIRNKMIEIIEMLKRKGATIDYVNIDYLEYAVPLYQIIALAEASSNLARFDGIRYGYQTDDYRDIDEMYKKTRTEGFGDEVKRRLMIGSYVLSGENAKQYYEKALKVRNAMRNSFVKIFKQYDLIIGPTTTSVAYQLGSDHDDVLKSFLDDIHTIPANMTGLPAISIPIGFNKDYLPIGMQIIGDYFAEAKIYQLAAFIENELKLVLNPNEKEG
jgi:aspartyl-tRNA(Asn)/glutamyl-tRNA(Gln) amidotransferase subunit A